MEIKLTKEWLQAVLNVVPDGYEIRFSIKAAQYAEVTLTHIYFDHSHRYVVIHVADYLNL